MGLRAEIQAYAHDVVNGVIPACKRHVWAAQRAMSDFEREDTDDFPYRFEESRGELFLDWLRMFRHVKGVLAGQLIEPDIVLKFIFGQVYAWTHRDTGYRRFTKVYWQVARKNAKSQTLAGVGTFEQMVFLGGVELSEVYIGATKKDQASIVFDEAVAMLRTCPDLAGEWEKSYGKIVHERTRSIMRALSEEDKTKGDGLNPQCGIIDEYHAHETTEIYDVIDSGMGARAQPLLLIITTAGFELNHPCYRVEYDLVSKILDPVSPVRIDSYFALVCELDRNDTTEDMEIDGRVVRPGDLIDDIDDERNWPKANPIVCTYPEGRENLRKKHAEAREAPEKMRNFLTKNMDVWVNMREFGYMDLLKWSAAFGEFPDLTGAECYVGVDLSAKNDLTSVGFVFKVGDRYYVKGHSFTPADTMDARAKRDRVDYGQWVRDGFLTAIPGEIVDHRVVKKWILDTLEENEWRPLVFCLDMWSAGPIAGELIDESHKVVEIVQGIKTLSEPTKDFRDMVTSKRVVHDGNPVITWAVGNAIADVVDKNLNIMLNKKKSTQRIDPIAAILNAYVRALVGAEDGAYANRGMRSLSD